MPRSNCSNNTQACAQQACNEPSLAVTLTCLLDAQSLYASGCAILGPVSMQGELIHNKTNGICSLDHRLPWDHAMHLL